MNLSPEASQVAPTPAVAQREDLRIRSFRVLDRLIPYVPLIQEPTPIQNARYRAARFMIKREDLTDTTVYGGNKVRNLEFILAQALIGKRERIATPIPVGSNFSAAFVGHAKRVGLDPILCQVLLAHHPQIADHRDFCQQFGTKMTTRSGYLKFPLQFSDVARAVIGQNAQFVPPGASNVLGAIGHMKGFFEVVDQVRAGTIPMPDVIYVGAGTGGTTAGLLVGIALSGFKTKIVAVRCAEKIICNSGRIISLANSTLRYLGSDMRINSSAFDLIECPGNERYGEPLAEFDQIFETFYRENGLELDRTYTSKVVKAMERHLSSHIPENSSVLYWHTFSPMASRETERIQLRKQHS